MAAKVAIIEDDRAFLRLIKYAINGSGEFRFIGFCASIQSALFRIPNAKPDLILAGIGTNYISEIETVINLKCGLPQVKVVIVTSVADPMIVREAFRRGANGYVIKRCPPAELLEIMRFALAGQVLLPQALVGKIAEAPSQFASSPVALALLTPRELEVMELLDKGKAYKAIADFLRISPGTVGQHLHHIYEKLGAGNKVEALNKLYPFRSQRSDSEEPQTKLLSA